MFSPDGRNCTPTDRTRDSVIVRCWQPCQDAETNLSPVPTESPRWPLMHTRCPCTCLSASLGNPAQFGGPDAGAHVASGPWSSEPMVKGLWSRGQDQLSRRRSRVRASGVAGWTDCRLRTTRTDRAWLGMVESQHFPPDVENLVKPLLSTFGAPLRTPCMATPTMCALATLERLTERKDRSTQRGRLLARLLLPPCHPVRA